MTTLTDRYVWGVLRTVPEGQRAELEPEIRALIADAVEARTAERPERPRSRRRPSSARPSTELGDPEVLAARYTDRSLVLIGPRFFLVWKRLLLTLLPIVVPIATVVAHGRPGRRRRQRRRRSSGAGSPRRSTLSIQLVFWFTLVFAMHRALRRST